MKNKNSLFKYNISDALDPISDNCDSKFFCNVDNCIILLVWPADTNGDFDYLYIMAVLKYIGGKKTRTWIEMKQYLYSNYIKCALTVTLFSCNYHKGKTLIRSTKQVIMYWRLIMTKYFSDSFSAQRITVCSLFTYKSVSVWHWKVFVVYSVRCSHFSTVHKLVKCVYTSMQRVRWVNTYSLPTILKNFYCHYRQLMLKCAILVSMWPNKARSLEWN